MTRAIAAFAADKAPIAANDNGKGQLVSLAVEARRREIAARAKPSPEYETLKAQIEQRQAIGRKWDGRRVFAWPTAKRLLKQGRTIDLRNLYLYRELVCLAEAEPANDNWPDGQDPDDETLEPVDATNLVDRHLQRRPTEAELQRAWQLGFVQPVNGDWTAYRAVMTREHVAHNSNGGPDGRRYALGGLVFDHRRRLIEFVAAGRRPHIEKPRDIRVLPAPNGDPLPQARSSVMKWHCVDHIEARATLAEIQRTVEPGNAAVLELAIGPSTAAAIGEELLGATGKSAERRGIAAIDTALKCLSACRDLLASP